jgi:hypothetical protein
MARCPVELLDDIADVLRAVRAWEGVVEKSPGVFYAQRLPFLHFHLIEDGRGRADIKSPTGWRSFDLPRPLPAARRQQFVRALRAHHAERMPPTPRQRRT